MSEEINKLVPKLRFPEFRDNGDWEEKKLGDISDVRDGTHDSPKFVSEGKPLLTSKNLLPTGCLNFQNASLISEYDYNQINRRSKVNYGDILFGMIGTIGNPVLVKHEGFAIKNVALIKEVKELLNTYLIHFLNSDYINAKFDTLMKGNAQKFIALGVIRNITIHIPNLKEQQKIADCLSSLNDLISAQNQKLEALKTYKKGMMQQLFPAEGETVPQLRFPEFRDSGDWEEETLENLSTKISDGIHATPVYDDNGVYYFINGNNLVNGKILIDEKSKRVSENEYQKHKRELNQSSILFSINGTIGNISVYNDEKVVLGKSACYININKSKANKLFIIYFLQTENINKYFHFELTGSTIKNLSLKTIKNTLVNLPKPNEQQKIVDFLSSLDKQIFAQKEKLVALKQHKKGLMQQLFPNTI